MTPHDIYLEARRRGLRLEPRPAGKLAVLPKGACPPDFRELLIEHKAELLAWLSQPSSPDIDRNVNDLPDAYFSTFPARTAPGPPLRPTECAWLTVARQVAVGEFNSADSSTIESVFIGLKSLAWHSAARAALLRLAGEPACPQAVLEAIRAGLSHE